MKTWEDCVAFHGHQCGGLTIGYKASLLAARLLELTFSEDEQVVCIAENNACGIDAIQVMLGCTLGKGNLVLHLVGKSAYSFYNRKTGRSVRLVLKPQPEGLSRENSLAYYGSREPEELFQVKETVLPLPEKAQLFGNFVCQACQETAGEAWMVESCGKKLCLDCAAASGEGICVSRSHREQL